MLHSEKSQAPAVNERNSYYAKWGERFQKGIIPIAFNNQDDPVVDARTLHAKLRVATRFNDWIERRIQEYGFKEGEDFYSNLSKSTGGRRAVDYELSINMAKELAMLENNEQGKMVRSWFIVAEKMLRILLDELHQPINGVYPLYENGRVGYPRKEALISLSMSPRNGYKLKKKYANECFTIGRTSCITAQLFQLLKDVKEIKSRQLSLFKR